MFRNAKFTIKDYGILIKSSGDVIFHILNNNIRFDNYTNCGIMSCELSAAVAYTEIIQDSTDADEKL